MREADRERVRGIRRRCLGKPEQHAHHESHLLLLRAAAADDALLHAPRRIFVDRQPALRRGDQRRTARRAERDRRPVALHKNHAFDHRALRRVPRDQRRDAPADRDEARARQQLRRIFHHAVFQRAHFAGNFFQHGKAAAAQGWIDRDDSHAASIRGCGTARNRNFVLSPCNRQRIESGHAPRFHAKGRTCHVVHSGLQRARKRCVP